MQLSLARPDFGAFAAAPRLFPIARATLAQEIHLAAGVAAHTNCTDLAVRQLRWAFRLSERITAPRILPDTTDEMQWERASAHDLAIHAQKRTGKAFEIVRRQGDYARRLDALAAHGVQQ